MKTEFDNHLNAYLLPKTVIVTTKENKELVDSSVLKKFFSNRSKPRLVKNK